MSGLTTVVETVDCDLQLPFDCEFRYRSGYCRIEINSASAFSIWKPSFLGGDVLALMGDEAEFPADRVFLHLSDIHFRDGRTGDVHDPDNDLRNELERDLRTISTTRVQKIDGIIVSGDIAFAGQPKEFDFAKGWLQHVSELIGCSADAIILPEIYGFEAD